MTLKKVLEFMVENIPTIAFCLSRRFKLVIKHSLIIIVIPVIVVLQGCFPDFYEEKVIKEIRQEKVSLKWVEVIGILDQDFPDYVTIQVGKRKQKDTICFSHNIAEVKMQSDTITIAFYGPPTRYDELIAIPQKMGGFNIKIDTLDVPTKTDN